MMVAPFYLTDAAAEEMTEEEVQAVQSEVTHSA